MKRILKTGLLLTGTLFGLVIGPMAIAQTCAPTQDPKVCVTVSAPASVTKSTTTDPTYWAIGVQIYNGAANVLNRVTFNGSLLPTPAEGPLYFVDPATGLSPSNPAVYLTTTNPAITCAVINGISLACGSDETTSIQPGQTLAFTVMSNVLATTGSISFIWQASFAEGGSASPNANNGTASGTLTAQVNEPSPDSAAASFPGTGGTLATAPDSFTTKIKIPATGSSTNATISETPSLDARCRNFRTCYTSDISIPGFVTTQVDPLTIDLFMAESNIRKGVKVENVLIYYTYQDASGNPVEVAVGPCVVPGAPNGDGIPCLDKFVNYKNSKSLPSWTTPAGFGFYWRFLNTKNGSFNLW